MKRLDLGETLERTLESFRPGRYFTFDEVLTQFQRWRTKAWSCRRGEVCVVGGTPATEFIMVAEGVLHVKIPSRIGEDIILRAVRQGEYVGITHLYSPEERHLYDVIAGSDAVFFAFNVAEVSKARTEPKLLPLFDYLGRHLSNVCRDAQAKATILAGNDIAERLRRYLAVRMQKDGKREVAIPGSAGDLARYLGVNPCALSRAIGRLRAEGKLAFEKNVLKVLC